MRWFLIFLVAFFLKACGEAEMCVYSPIKSSVASADANRLVCAEPAKAK